MFMSYRGGYKDVWYFFSFYFVIDILDCGGIGYMSMYIYVGEMRVLRYDW